jgi:hypothetical protein
MNEDSYLDASYEDKYDDPWWADDQWDEYDEEDEDPDEYIDDDFPMSMEYPQDYLEDIEPSF